MSGKLNNKILARRMMEWERDEKDRKWKKPDSEFHCRTIGVLRSSPLNKGMMIYVQVVQWGDKKPTLEKRPCSVFPTGKIRWKRAQGLTLDDLKLIFANKDQVEKWLADWQKPEPKPSDNENIPNQGLNPQGETGNVKV